MFLNSLTIMPYFTIIIYKLQYSKVFAQPVLAVQDLDIVVKLTPTFCALKE